MPIVTTVCISTHLSLLPPIRSYIFMFSFFPVPHQAPLSMGFSRQEYWSRLPFSPPGGSSWPSNWTLVPYVSCITRGFFTTSAPWGALQKSYSSQLSLLPYMFKLPPLPVLPVKPIMKFKNSALKKKPHANSPTPITLSPLSPSFHFKFLKGMPYVLGMSNPLFPVTHNLVSVPLAPWKWLEFSWQK